MVTLRSLCVAFLFFTSLVLFVQSVEAQTSRTVTRQFEFGRDGHVELDTFSGKVEVTGWDQNTVDVEARIEGEDAEFVDKTAIQFDERSGRLVIKADYDEVEDTQQFLGLFNIGNVDRPDVFFTIRTPRSTRLTVDDFSSEISVIGLDADVSLDTFSSSVRLRDLNGTFDLETFSGSVDGENLRGRVRLETFSGDIRLTMNELTGDSQFETFSGDIELTLPADAAFELVGDDDTFGELSSEFALKIRDGRRIAGEGGVEIDVESFSGDLQLRKH